MIADFFRQTNDTIVDFLSKVGGRKDLFSTYSYAYHGMEDYLICFYATKHEIVLLAVDTVEDGTMEYADKGLRLHVNLPCKCFRKVNKDGKVSKDSEEWRISPASDLFYAALRMRQYIASEFELVPAIHCMLLTNSTIVNYPKVIGSWQQSLFGFSVLHQVKEITRINVIDSRMAGRPLIAINEDYNAEGSEYWAGWHKYSEARGWYDWQLD